MTTKPLVENGVVFLNHLLNAYKAMIQHHRQIISGHKVHHSTMRKKSRHKLPFN